MMIRKKSKGFTLIELLVVVAIIGILASVGVVAYSGYTTSAKKAAAKSNHNSVKKWIQNELQKCNIGETTAMGTALTCTGRTDATIVTAVIKSLATDSNDMMNPWATTEDAVTSGAIAACTDDNKGQTGVAADASGGIALSTCTDAAESGAGGAKNLYTLTVSTD